jgi:hypothetical protein
MWIGCMHLVDLLLFLEEILLEHSPRRIIILFILLCILGGRISCRLCCRLQLHEAFSRLFSSGLS